jgi:hypothetical protein
MGLDEVKRFIVPILNTIGFVTNLLSISVFSLIIKNEQRGDDMYKHLLLKSICEMLGNFFSLLNNLGYISAFGFTYMMAFWYIWFENYIKPALFMASIGFEIAATFNCAISIEKRMKWCEKRLSFWIWVVSILILSFGIEIFPVFAHVIYEETLRDQFNRTIHRYSIMLNHLNDALWDFHFAENIIKELIFLVILLSLNCYILYKLIQIGRRKKRLTSNNSNIQNSNRAENRKIIMIIILFLTFVLGHSANLLYFGFHFGDYRIWSHLFFYGDIFLNLSYSTSFFVYFAFNNIFRRLFLKIICFRSFI